MQGLVSVPRRLSVQAHCIHEAASYYSLRTDTMYTADEMTTFNAGYAGTGSCHCAGQ